jgi:cytochrome b561
MQTQPRADGYSRASIVIHWLAAIVVISLFLTHEGERGDAEYMFHVGAGAIFGLFLLWRVWRRVARSMTAKPAQPPLLNLLSQVVLWGFLVAIVVVTITGYMVPWSLGRPLDIFGIVSIPSPISGGRGLHAFMEEAHEISGQVFPLLLILHVAGAIKHRFWDKDGIAERMFRPVTGGR